MKIKLKLGVSEDTKTLTIIPVELGYTDEDWKDMLYQEQHNVISTFIDSLTEQPYWYLESFKTL
jgi:hypothetical protein